MIISVMSSLMEERTPPSINHNCHYHYRVAACDACLSSCPTKAINLEKQIISDDLCYRCGKCIEVCKYQAIDNVSLPKRNIIDKRIQLSKNEELSFQELYSWSQVQPDLEGISINQKNPELESQIDQLNHLLEKQGQLKWTIVIEKRVDISKRRLFSFVKPQTISSQLRLEQLKVSEQFNLYLDKQQCSSCFVCMRACPQPVFDLVVQKRDEAIFTIDASECNGCNSCMELCPQNAIHATNRTTGNERTVEEALTMTSHSLIKQTCQQCYQVFWSMKAQSKCFICHTNPSLGMKE